MRLLAIFIFCLYYVAFSVAQDYSFLQMPNQEMLQTDHVLCVIQDSEGCMWYGTEGDGVYRDDGRHINAFRNDASHPTLLGSNNIASLAESGSNIIIGTFHGAYVLNKLDFSIKRIDGVDDKRVDDILVCKNGKILLTANKKIYSLQPDLSINAVYTSRWHGHDTYVARLTETSSGDIWATQWNGGLTRFDGDKFAEMPWNTSAHPTNIAETGQDGCLWVGTIGEGIVRYRTDNGTITHQPQTGNTICTDLRLSADGQHLWMIAMNKVRLFKNSSELTEMLLPDNPLLSGTDRLNRLASDRQGRLLVASSKPESFVITRQPQTSWIDIARRRLNQNDTSRMDSIALSTAFTTPPEAFVIDREKKLWFSTGRDVRCMSLVTHKETATLNIPDISALAVTDDGNLWFASAYGNLYRYRNGKADADDYASNENGDGVVQLLPYEGNRLLIVYNKYTRIYDPIRKTLRQQSREANGTYCIEMAETEPGKRWNRPQENIVVKEIPNWLTSWWMLCIGIMLLAVSMVVLIHYFYLRRQRHLFLQNIKGQDAQESDDNTDDGTTGNAERKEWLHKAIKCVEDHLSDVDYSVELMSSDLCMSRMTLYRKIQSVTGQKPSEFIRTIRLSHAAKMLQQTDMTISEISDATGFSSVSYFSRCFRTMYGVSPKEHRETT